MNSNGVPILNDEQKSLLTFLQNPSRVFRNYQPIVIKTLLEKGSDEHFSASIDEIKEKITLLNFDREDFEINNAIDAVSGALKEYVVFSNKSVSLNLDYFSDDEIPDCLKICNKEIAKWHVKTVMKDENNIYIIQAGGKGDWIKEFQESKTAGVSYHEIAHFDLTGMSKEEIENKTNGEAVTELYNISQIKRGDIIAVTLSAKKGIENFGIATSGYYFDSISKTYAHRINLEYLNFGAAEINTDIPKAIFKTTDLEKPIKNFLLGLEHLYFIVRHKPDSHWDDVEGNKYHFGKGVANQKKLRDAGVGTKTIWYTTEDGEYYFWGYGTVKKIETVQENEQWNLVYDDFTFFEKQDDSLESEGKFLKRGNELVKQQIQNAANFNKRNAMTQITKKIYEDITGDKTIMSSIGEQIKKDEKLDLELYIEALNWKPNLILYGPPGTGKTYYAIKIGEKLTSTNFSSLVQPSSVHTMSDDEYGEFIIESIKKESETNGYIFKVEKEKYNFILEKGKDKIHLRLTYSKSATNDKNNCYCGIDDGAISFLKRAPEDNRYIITINHSVKNFVVLPYSIEQKYAKFAGAINSENWDPTGINAHSYHIKIYDEEASFGGTNYDCKKFVRNIKQIFGQFVKTVTFHQTFSYEEFIEGIKANPTKDKSGVTYDVEPGIFKEFCNMARNDSKNQYVMIIDEINRGNIAKIFGELITIIEKDKRGKPITLAYSKEKFSVPKNILIIGTMNTADQSLTHLDAALKRRFTMMEHYPNPNILKNYKVNDEINLTDLLKAINNKLMENNFRDGQIGHSYFMNGEEPLTKISDLQMVFAYDIIPLLRDYFYDDESKLKEIFGEHWFGKNKDINDDWQGPNNTKKFRDNIQTSFGV